MKTTFWAAGGAAAALAAIAFALPASAKTEVKKDVPHCQWRHTYAEAIEEAKERNCVIFATMHIDH